MKYLLLALFTHIHIVEKAKRGTESKSETESAVEVERMS